MSGYPGAKEILARHGLEPKREWGQNFLSDAGVLERIARVTGAGEGDRVVELGAGLGHLTVRLAGTGAEVVAVERDRELVPILESELAELPNVTVLPADAKKIDVAALRGDGPKLMVVGNLPYHLTSPILFHVLEAREHVARIVVMVQKEVAERIVAGPGTKAYGVLSVRFQILCDVRLAFVVPPGAFLPPPKVSSAVVRMDVLEAPRFDWGDAEIFRRVVKAAFGQRRKTIWNAVRSGRIADDELVRGALDAVGIDAGERAERIPVEGFAALSRAIVAGAALHAGSTE